MSFLIAVALSWALGHLQGWSSLLLCCDGRYLPHLGQVLTSGWLALRTRSVARSVTVTSGPPPWSRLHFFFSRGQSPLYSLCPHLRVAFVWA